MANFPTLSIGEDASKFDVDYEDVTLKSKTDGGYVFTRPRHTRTARRMFTTGLKDISHADYLVMTAFVELHNTHTAFSYTLPTTSEVVNVRFMKVPKAKYKGYGTNFRYNYTSIKMEEV